MAQEIADFDKLFGNEERKMQSFIWRSEQYDVPVDPPAAVILDMVADASGELDQAAVLKRIERRAIAILGQEQFDRMLRAGTTTNEIVRIMSKLQKDWLDTGKAEATETDDPSTS